MLSPNVVAQLAANELFRTVDELTLHALAEELESARLRPGEQLFLQGDPGNSMYVLVKGRLGVSISDSDGNVTGVDELAPGASVGEMALLTGQARVATVTALEDAELIKLSRRGFERLAEQHPQLIMEFTRRMLPRFQRTLLAGILTHLFGALDAAAVHALQAELGWRRFASGEVLFRQGEMADGMFVVVSGRMRIVAGGVDGGERLIGEIGAGEMVGEFALLTDDPRSATVYAIRDTDVVQFSRSLFERLVERYPRMILQITRLIVEHSKRAAGQNVPRGAATTFALVPAGPDVPLDAFAERLEHALARFGPTLRLSSERFDRAYGRPEAAQIAEDHPIDVALMAWLGERERRYQYVVYQADATWSAWSRRCIRQADRVLVVGSADASPAVGEVEQQIARRAAPGAAVQTELVLLHTGTEHLPVGTRRWLAPRSLALHHHIRRDSQADIERLARLLAGFGVGLVLGGGGARGFAHIGVIRALREAGIPIDLVGGTSIGSCIGAQVAMGLDWAAMAAINRRGFVDMNPLSDYTLPIVAMLNARKLNKVYAMMFGDARIEDLWLKYFCISSNLTRGEMLTHETGRLCKYVRASMSVPGVAPPVPDNGSLLIDGGVLNNLPADVMRRLCGKGYVIAVDVNPSVDLAASVDYGASLSGWYVAWRSLNPFGPRLSIPNIHAILERATSLSSVRQAAELAYGAADLYLHPPVEGFGMFEVKALDRIIDAGYRCARERLIEWRKGGSW
jgi:predicted acylesterase/phospholipase RssA/CRP-like cAMP-binding protein